jgi:hypothetical protein
MNPTTDHERLAIEIIASLINIKTTMAELLLNPAGVPREVYGPLLYFPLFTPDEAEAFLEAAL